jgi:hypothetical protein
MQQMQLELRKNEEQAQQMLKQLSKFEINALDVKAENEILVNRASDLEVTIKNLEKDLQRERQDREGEKDNYFILYERFKKLVTQQSGIAHKYEDAVLTEKTLREEEMLTRLKSEVL